MKKQLFSFGCALRGFWDAVCSEGHLRFELTAAVYAVYLSVIARFSAGRVALICVLSSAVIAAELINTALEALCDLVTGERNPIVRLVKDIAASAVLVLAAGAVAVAALFFGDIRVINAIIGYFSDNPAAIIPPAAAAVVAVPFIAAGPRGFKKLFARILKTR